MRRLASAPAWILLAACVAAPGPAQREGEGEGPAPRVPAPLAAVTSGPVAPVAPSGLVEVPGPAPVAPPSVPAERARVLLFPEGAPPACGERDVRCWIDARYAADPGARAAALALFDEGGDVAGLEGAYAMDGGFRGTIQIVPELPVGPHARHLAWIRDAQRDIGTFAAAIEARAGAPPRFRHRALAFRFARSVGRTTPSAWAGGWEVAYNVSGSLHRSAEAVRDTLLHEVFHLNDQAAGDWSRRALGPLVDGLVARCGTRAACLAPHAPMPTMVRGGTYYAFQPDNGDPAHEYAAELATRYFLEQREALAGRARPGTPFKCGPAPNAEAWTLLAAEFFGGVDAVPACPP